MISDAMLKKCFREPIEEIFDASRYLDAAVTAHTEGDFELAKKHFSSANIEAVWNWTDSIWGANSQYVKVQKSDRHHIVSAMDISWFHANSELPSWLQGGSGKLRYDNDHDGLRINRLFMDYRGRITPTLSGRFTVNMNDNISETIDLTEFLRRMAGGIYDKKEYKKALAWVKTNCPEGKDYNPPKTRRTSS